MSTTLAAKAQEDIVLASSSADGADLMATHQGRMPTESSSNVQGNPQEDLARYQEGLAPSSEVDQEQERLLPWFSNERLLMLAALAGAAFLVLRP